MCDNLDQPNFHDERWVKARKPHRCYACSEEIRPGDRYRLLVGKWEGEFEQFRHCARCDAISRALYDAGAEEVAIDLDCGETYEENFGPLPDAIAALAFMTPDEGQMLAGKEGDRG